MIGSKSGYNAGLGRRKLRSKAQAETSELFVVRIVAAQTKWGYVCACRTFSMSLMSSMTMLKVGFEIPESAIRLNDVADRERDAR
jgi:hypothetical protein